MFADRTSAGKQLAAEVRALAPEGAVVLALPRGGVPVAAEVARQLDAPLDLLIVRKVGAPANPELAMAALVDGTPPELVINAPVLAQAAPSETEFDRLVERERQELLRRRQTYLGNRAPIDVAGRTVILVDDGIATGTTVKAALKGLRARHPKTIILAVPVAPDDSLVELAKLVDYIVCLRRPAFFHSVGAYYDDFPQLDDQAVIACLEASGSQDPPLR
jgi:putative phosphoribosyl transferase